MGSSVKPPDNPDELAKLIGGQPPAAPAAPAAGKAKKQAAKPEEPRQLPLGKMGDPCSQVRQDGSKCPGKLTDLGGHYPDPKNKVVRTTLVCSKCSVVQARAEVRDPNY